MRTGVRLNPYDTAVAEAFKASRELARHGLAGWRDAVARHVAPTAETVLLDLGAGTGAFSRAFAVWFPARVVAVEPSAALRSRIPQSETIEVIAGDAAAIPLADDSVDAVWLSLVLHHLPDLEAAAREIGRVVRAGGPVLIRQGFPDRPLDGIEMIRWFPETARVVETYPTLAATTAAFAAAGLRLESIESVEEIGAGGLRELLDAADTLRTADTTLRSLADEEFRRGKERLRKAIDGGSTEPRSNRLDLAVFR
jgi:ubiquinone/menaquinone biosynthesis C-methylase UbiE